MRAELKCLTSIFYILLIVIALSFSSATDPPLPVGDYKADATEILAAPSQADWKSLEQYSGTLSREEFNDRLHFIFDPSGTVSPYLEISDQSVKIYPNKGKTQPPLAEIAFSTTEYRRPAPTKFRSPSEIQAIISSAEKPLSGLRIVVDPADIGGEWAIMENRAQKYKGYGQIREGDLNLTVGKILAAKLESLGAKVFLTHDTLEPVSGLTPGDLTQHAADLLAKQPKALPKAYFDRTQLLSNKNPKAVQIAAEVLLTKTVEARARADKVRKSFQPDITIVLQHNATSKSQRGAFARLNRNVFFVHGAYTRRELSEEPHQRLKMLRKLLQNVTPIEATVAEHIANRFVTQTGFPPVRYGNSSITRSPLTRNPYVVARNLILNREHDGPVVITEPYFMNEKVTLQRLVQGDYEGTRWIAGAFRPSIYREYADTVALGLLDVYGYRMQVGTPTPPPQANSALLDSLSPSSLSSISLKQEPTPPLPLQELLNRPSPPPPLSKQYITNNIFTPFIRPVLVVSLLLGASMGLFWISSKYRKIR